MLKKTIAYEDFNGDPVVEDHYFHLSKADLIELEMGHKGGLHDYLQRIVASEDGKAIITEFKQLILMSYGTKSEDGKRFIKTQEMRDEFVSTEAYSTLFMELCTQADKAAEFINGIIPAGLEADLAKLATTMPPDGQQFTTSSTEHMSPMPKILTHQEVLSMDGDELKSGLATGRYTLS